MTFNINKQGVRNYTVPSSYVFEMDGVLYELTEKIACRMLHIEEKYKDIGTAQSFTIPDNWLHPIDHSEPMEEDKS